MRVKKFEAKSMKDALRMVKAELGPDAVILGARENKRSFGLGGDSSFEITAAVSETTLQKKRFVESRLRDDDRETFRTSDARTQKRIMDKMVQRRLHTQEQERSAAAPAPTVSAVRPRPMTSISYIDIEDDVPPTTVYARRSGLTTAPKAAPKTAPKTIPAAGGMEMVGRSDSRAETNQSDVRGKIKSLARQAFEASAAMTPAPSKLAQLTKDLSIVKKEKEIETLKEEVQRLQKVVEGFQKVPEKFQGTAHPGSEFGLAYDFSFAFQRLVETGMASDLAAEILMRASKEIDPINAKKRAIVEAWVAKWILQNIAVCERPFAARVHVFVGPMAGGKTSQLVKAASHLVIREKKRIAVVTTDTSKVGAVDQLKIYCQILNVPFAVVRDKSDWQWITQNLQGVDHLLVDAPGLSMRDMDEIQNLRAILPGSTLAGASDAMQVHLCLSSAMKESDALEAVRRFRVVQPTDLVFTGLDLSVQHGVIATVQLRSGLPLHSFGIGPQIPEDFEFATKERVLDLLFKLSTLKRTTEK